MTKFIPLTRGMVALVDDEDFDRLSAFSWSAVKGRRESFYASRGVGVGEPLMVRTRQMQRDVLDPLGEVPSHILADHRNGDTLDCRKENLRWASFEESNRNRRILASNTSGYRGVWKNKTRWRASIRAEGRLIQGGGYATPEEAAAAYNALALQYHGPDAKLNVVPEAAHVSR